MHETFVPRRHRDVTDPDQVIHPCVLRELSGKAKPLLFLRRR